MTLGEMIRWCESTAQGTRAVAETLADNEWQGEAKRTGMVAAETLAEIAAFLRTLPPPHSQD